MQLSCKVAAFKNNSNHALLSILSFFPIAFMLTEKGKAIRPAQARLLSLSDENITIDASDHLKNAEFPFNPLVGDQILMLTDYQAICSYPIGN